MKSSQYPKFARPARWWPLLLSSKTEKAVIQVGGPFAQEDFVSIGFIKSPLISLTIWSCLIICIVFKCDSPLKAYIIKSIQRKVSYWTYTIHCITMKMRILNKNIQTLEWSGREKKINTSLTFTAVWFTKLLWILDSWS